MKNKTTKRHLRNLRISKNKNRKMSGGTFTNGTFLNRQAGRQRQRESLSRIANNLVNDTQLKKIKNDLSERGKQRQNPGFFSRAIRGKKKVTVLDADMSDATDKLSDAIDTFNLLIKTNPMLMSVEQLRALKKQIARKAQQTFIDEVHDESRLRINNAEAKRLLNKTRAQTKVQQIAAEHDAAVGRKALDNVDLAARQKLSDEAARAVAARAAARAERAKSSKNPNGAQSNGAQSNGASD